ncbi:MAG: polysaccharide deacetylase family protein [Alphaproteobacteria bacterium]
MKRHLATLTKRGLIGLGFPARRLQRADQAFVLFYHGIGGRNGIPTPAFEQQIRYVARHFEPVFARDLGVLQSSPRLRVAITIDDGLKNTLNVALPILRKHGVKATIFVISGDHRWLWTSELRERLRTSLGRTVDGRPIRDAAAVDGLVRELKAMTLADRDAAMARIRAETSFDPSPEWLAEYELMTPEQLQSLPEDLVEIGAHTVNHPILDRLDTDAIEREIVESKRGLEALLGRPVLTFAYPNGDFDRRCRDIAERHYRFAFTTDQAIEDKPERQDLLGHPHAIYRMHGTDRFVDAPIRMQRLLQRGFGFRPG